MIKPAGKALPSLTALNPEINARSILESMTPPPEFSRARFTNYLPDAAFPSQRSALVEAEKFAAAFAVRRLRLGKAPSDPGIYFDGGFGVGKTHLLASIWHKVDGEKLFGSFLEYTSAIGFLGFASAVELMSKYRLICIDEFELDDPGDTMIMSRLLKELSVLGVKFAATSNTPPNALGEGRFAAADFQREIQGLGNQFRIVTIDGEDFRHRDPDGHAENLETPELEAWCSAVDGHFDTFDDLLVHLSSLHPTRYRTLLAGVRGLGLSHVRRLDNQLDALRFVSFVDRAYELQIPIRSSGSVSITDIFGEDMLHGGYRKKYLRCISRLSALSALNR